MLMIFWQVSSRPVWLAVMAAQFSWPFAGLLLGATVTVGSDPGQA
jgi:hypothetical protein